MLSYTTENRKVITEGDFLVVKIRIIAHSSEPFQNRSEAGKLLMRELKGVKAQDTVVLGIPRGGIVIAEEISLRLNCVLDVVFSRKIGAPGNPELAIGAIGEEGKACINKKLVNSLGVNSAYIEQEKNAQFSLIKLRALEYREIIPKASLKGKIAIVVDDGAATGATIESALLTMAQESPQKLIAALPVGPPDTIERLSEYADEIICLRAPDSFGAISQFYNEFLQVEDAEVIKILRKEAQRRKSALHVTN
ncbi:MAG: phosphoribosyltransferase family protein [Candidatus Omnitrophota bacterium]